VSDPRLNSAHLGLLPRRQEYRQARAALQAERGWLTLAAERVERWAGEGDNWPSLLPRPEEVLPGTKYLLIDRQTGDAYPLRTGLNTVGRLPDNDIVLNEIWVSRRHCALLVHARGGCELHDTASRNGTFVNGQRLTRPVRLSPGDRVGVAGRQFLFVRAEDAAGGEDEGHPDTAVL
jgi:pSer/pThr/pTyr-binding forkhead associated (FHA) protein